MIRRQHIICCMYPDVFKQKELLVCSYIGSKDKTQKCTVNMLLRYYDLSFFINRVDRIMVMVQRIVQILCRRYSDKEYREHHPTNYFYSLLPQ